MREKRHEDETIFSDFVSRNVTEYVNLTPHEVTVYLDNDIVRIPPSGMVARVDTRIEDEGVSKDGITVVLVKQGRVYVVKCGERRDKQRFPNVKKGTVYLVSVIVARELMRADVWSPDTSDDGVVRDGRGYIIGVKRFQCFSEDFVW